MLTAEERRFLTDHLRPVGRTATRLAAIQLALVGGGYLAGWAIGTAIGATHRLLHDRRPFSLFGG